MTPAHLRPWVLVTGAGRRLGRASALALAAGGRNVAVHFNASQGEAEETAQGVRAAGGEAVVLSADLGDPAAAEELLGRAAAMAGAPIPELVNAAAIFEHDLLETATAEALDRHMRINTLAPSLLMRALAARLPDGARGAVVNFLDFKLAQPYPDHFTYSLSKYALLGATELAARGLAPRVRVNAVAPGYVLPAPGQPDADFARLHAQTPLMRGATADDVAQAVVYLMDAAAVSGQTIFVDAGLRFVSHDRDFAFR